MENSASKNESFSPKQLRQCAERIKTHFDSDPAASRILDRIYTLHHRPAQAHSSMEGHGPLSPSSLRMMNGRGALKQRDSSRNVSKISDSASPTKIALPRPTQSVDLGRVPNTISQSESTKDVPVKETFTASLHLEARYLREFKSGNFIYLRRKPASSYGIYDLQVAEHHQVDRNDYFTMSMEGVTHFTTAHSEFWTLQKWEDEYARFRFMIQIPFFLKYRLWKTFTVWKSIIRFCKIRNAKRYLIEKFVLLLPFLQKSILELRRLCVNIANLELIFVEPCKIYTLQALEAEQKLAREKTATQIEEFSRQSTEICMKACDDVINAFLQANKIQAEQKMSFMERAALRKECRKLTGFLRLADYLTINAIIELIFRSFRALLSALSSPLLSADSKAGNSQEAVSSSRSPLFTVTVENGCNTSDTDQAQGIVRVEPSLESWNLTLQNILKEALKTVETPVRHLGHKRLASYTAATIEDEGKGNMAIDPLSVALILNYDANFRQLTDDIFRALKQSFKNVQEYLNIFSQYQFIYTDNLRHLESMWEIYENASLEYFTESIMKYEEQKVKLSHIPELSAAGAFQVSSSHFKNRIVPTPEKCIQSIRELLPNLMKKNSSELIETINELSPIAFSSPSNPESFVQKVVHMQRVIAQLPLLKINYHRIYGIGVLMDTHEWRMPDELKEDIILMKEGVLALESMVTRYEGDVDADTVKFSQQITESVAPLVRSMQALSEKLEHPKLATLKTPSADVLAYLQQQQLQLDHLKTESKKLNSFQSILKQPTASFEELDEVTLRFELMSRLWMSTLEWNNLKVEYYKMEFEKIDIAAIQKQTTAITRTAHQAQRAFPKNEVAIHLQREMEALGKILPVIADLRSHALQERHWAQIEQVTGFSIHKSAVARTSTEPATPLTLANMVERDMVQHYSLINNIAVTAQQEAVLEKMLHKVIDLWSNIELEVKTYKDSRDVYILGSLDDITVKLDESIVTISTILGSRYIGAIQDEVELWKKRLYSLQDTLDIWIEVQKKWLYLEAIFSASDIQKQLPDASKVFSHVDTSWKTIMRRTHENPNVMNAASVAGLRDMLVQHDLHLEQIQKNLEDYLETKRMAFPRFYFLSNDELLEILAQSKNPQAVQPHLRKCFENLVRVEFAEGAGNVDIVAMISAEGERVAFSKSLKARGNIEDWLKALETTMKSCIQKVMKIGLVACTERPRTEWVCEHPGQVIATVSQMTWARSTEIALTDVKSRTAMKMWYDRILYELNELIVKICGDLLPLHRKIIVALVTTDVHARDIVELLYTEDIDSTQSFVWQQQLRYYWDSQSEDVLIRHSDSMIPYGYEYMGATPRLVITPLTDRCWMTLTGAYGLKLGAAPAGPAGTGKTESSKDLAKAMAIQCVVFNCSDQIDYKMIGKLFRGLAQAGNWTCLDEFNRIDIEVLSVIAQQLVSLREGRVQQREHINFMGTEIPLKDHHVIVTMNPGYAGRSELPDNLKVCFRPVSMMVPDYALIAEIMLFAEGFSDARTLSRKMCKLYTLCSEQLSQQPHYDYGLRAVKSVLVMAGILKRNHPELDENITLIRALRDSNVPKFLVHDLPLFHAIVDDLFPGVSIPSHDYGEFISVLAEEIEKSGYQYVDTFVGKIVQLFDTFNVRFGAALVGSAGAGKTSCYKILQAAMSTLRSNRDSLNSVYQIVHVQVLYPKCISMGELYGEFHEATQEWHDGLASGILRNAVSDESKDYRWTVFDGPIDALWIENMNTVLDDNMTLCLANGERIKLKQEMKMLFEVMDLIAASPATVSRIGVVYMSSIDLGYRPYVQSWFQHKLSSCLPSEGKSRLEWNFKEYFDASLEFLHTMNNHELVPSTDINLASSLCTLIDILLRDPNLNAIGDSQSYSSPYYAQLDREALEAWIDKIFAFAIIWSVGGTISMDHLSLFDTFLRDLMTESKLGLPMAELLMHYYPDFETQKLVPWKDSVPKCHYDPNIAYFKIIVPTPDTVRLKSLLRVLALAQKPAYVTGVTGTGKTLIIQSLLSDLSQPLHRTEEKKALYSGSIIYFSAQTQSLMTQLTMESTLEKRGKDCLGPLAGKKMIIFVDDVNLPAVEEYGAQPPIELLRQFLDCHGFYDREKLSWKEIQDTLLFVAAAPAGGGRAQCTPRFLRHFYILTKFSASESDLQLIFTSILSGFLDRFPANVKSLTDGIVANVIELYDSITKELLPTPSKFYYAFNLRDISKVFQGILMATPSRKFEQDTMHYLWIHECSRVFQDRLNTRLDQKWFEHCIVTLLQRVFRVRWTKEQIFEDACPLLFANFVKGANGTSTSRTYEFCGNIGLMTKVLNDFQQSYNDMHSNKMKMVFFRDAVSHVTRLVRILSQPRGNAMLIGVGGSGKQSITRLASCIVDADCYQIEMTKGYGIFEFHEDLKKLLIATGIHAKSTVFLFTDAQIVCEQFLEDVNNLLNSGQVPNLFEPEEIDRIVSDMRPIVRKLGSSETSEECLKIFTERVREYLHIVLTMSPVGSALRVRCRAFPSLINCCTIDCYMNWPQEALQSVADRILASVDLPNEVIRGALVTMCSYVHTSSADYNELFLQQLQRRVYTTPKSYLSLLQLYVKMLLEKRKTLQSQKMKMEIGVDKLEETNTIVDSLKEELIELQPLLKDKAVQVEALLRRVSVDRESASKAREMVARDEPMVHKQAQEVALIQADAQKELDVAMPALRDAVEALDSLSKNDITEVKSFAKPPPAVETVMNAVCLLLNEKQSWDSAKKLLSESSFLDRLKSYDKDNISIQLLKKLNKYIADASMAVENVSKVSKAATSLCMWVHAMYVYSKVAKEVEPKRLKLEALNKELAAANEALRVKQSELAKIDKNLRILEQQCDDAIVEKDRLAGDAKITESRLARAELLMRGLSAEGQRWKDTVCTLGLSLMNLIGDIFLSAASISYYGPYTGPFRQKITSSWLEHTKKLGIPFSDNYSLASTLGDAYQIRAWQINGLPTDATSTDSAILVYRGERWPLMIDPQGQANKWINSTATSASGIDSIKLHVSKMSDVNLSRTLETCIRNGMKLLIEDIEETLEPILDPVLQKAVFQRGSQTLIHLGDSDVDYDANFGLYMTTRLANPHYSPEIFIKVTVINFTVTSDGLEDQLLGQVLQHERADVEDKKNSLIASLALDKQQLKDIEDRILRQLSESSGNVLDDQELLETLQSSKATSDIIKERVFESEATQAEISCTREEYRMVARRGSIIYFVIAQMSLIDPMYQFSLSFFQRLFKHCLRHSPQNSDVTLRRESLVQFMTRFIYSNICRGLFEAHKVLFSVLICCKIMLHANFITPQEWSLFLRGAAPGKMSNETPNTFGTNPAPDIISSAQWHLLLELEELEVMKDKSLYRPFQAISNSVSQNWSLWLFWIRNSSAVEQSLPSHQQNLSPFQKVLLVKALAGEKVPDMIRSMVQTEMGSGFLSLSTDSMEAIYKDTDNKTPCIFILSSGADPTGILLRFAKDRDYMDRLHLISLGQGQGIRAERLIQVCQGSGDWVLLQNCHLAKSWMPNLEKIVDQMAQPDGLKCVPDFRLFLTSFPASYFPVVVLQNAIKVTNEPPKGMRSNLIRSCSTMLTPELLNLFQKSESFQDGKPKEIVWRKMLMALAFFHATVQERRKFGPLGWNIRYEFNDTDLETSVASLRKFLEEHLTIPWDALRYMTGEINYGGRVTDDWDRRCLMSILRNYYTNGTVVEESYALSVSGTYRIPDISDRSHIMSYFDALPSYDSPELFGMHENANIVYERNEYAAMIRMMLSLEPREIDGEGGCSADQSVLNVAKAIQEQLPQAMEAHVASEAVKTRMNGGTFMDSMATVLSQEIAKFNRLLNCVQASLTELERAINGLSVMSSDLDLTYTALLDGRVPPSWQAVSFASLRSLASWVQDLLARTQFFKSWLLKGEPNVFELNAFFFPQGFLTGVLQNHARKYELAIDSLSFHFDICRDDKAPSTAPNDGVYISGLYLEGAQWCSERHELIDAKIGEMYSPMVLIHFLPATNVTRTMNEYPCPVYKTTARQGTLSTTGISTNYVITVYLPTSALPDVWIMRGTALLLNLND